MLEFKHGKKEGSWAAWNAQGTQLLIRSGTYSAGSKVSDPPIPLEGRWLTSHANGQKKSEGEYKNGELEGLWTYWNKDGSIWNEQSGIYKAGKKVAPLPKK